MNDNELYGRTENLLYSYRTIVAEANNLKITIQEAKEDYRGVTAVNFDEKTASTNKFSSVVETEVLAREKKLKSLEEELKSKEIMIQRIDNALESLSEREYTIIELKYFKKIKTWERIGERIELSGTYCSTLNGDIVRRIGRIIFIGKYGENS